MFCFFFSFEIRGDNNSRTGNRPKSFEFVRRGVSRFFLVGTTIFISFKGREEEGGGFFGGLYDLGYVFCSELDAEFSKRYNMVLFFFWVETVPEVNGDLVTPFS